MNAAFLLCRSIRCQSCNEQFDIEFFESAVSDPASACPFCRAAVSLSITPFDIYRRAFDKGTLLQHSCEYRWGVLDSLFHLFGLTNFEVRYLYGSAESVDYKAGIDKTKAGSCIRQHVPGNEQRKETAMPSFDSGELADSHPAGVAPHPFRPPHLVCPAEEVAEPQDMPDFEDNDEFDDI